MRNAFSLTRGKREVSKVDQRKAEEGKTHEHSVHTSDLMAFLLLFFLKKSLVKLKCDSSKFL